MKLVQMICLATFALVLTGCWNTGRGEKIGMITKLAKEGTFGCPTWEAEIVRGGFNAGSGVSGASFHFTIEDEKLVEPVKKAMESQQEVKISYTSELATLCRSEQGNHFLASIEPIGTIRPASRNSAEAQPFKVEVTSGTKVSGLDRQKIADSIVKQNTEVLRQNQQLIDLLKRN